MSNYTLQLAKDLSNLAKELPGLLSIKRLFGTIAPPRAILGNGSRLVYHFISRGALIGINQQLDPDYTPPHPVITVACLSALSVLCLISTGPLQLGLVLVLVSPLWLYAFVSIPDPIMENRAYLTMPGLAIIGAWAAERSFWSVILLVAVYSTATFRRNKYWSSRLEFWGRAVIESPRKIRPQVNYAVALSKVEKVKVWREVGGREEAAEIYESVLALGINNRECALAASNLALLFIHEHELTKDQEWMRRAIAVLHAAEQRWPDHTRIRFHRGTLFMGFHAWREAITELDLAIKLQPKHADAYRERAKCWGQLGDREKALADAARAEQLDGQAMNITYERVQELPT